MQALDWALLPLLPAVALIVGALVSRRSGRDSESYFLSGRQLPGWLLGISMVATTFSTDTPNLVTDIVRTHGVAGNWLWWALLPTGMVTAFIYAKLWRRSGVMTDLEFYQIRYSGRIAGWLRTFRALYIGVFFNVVVMASVSLAAIKIAAIMVGATPLQTLLTLGIVTIVFTSAGGFLGVVITDMILFVTAMVGSISAAVYLVDLPQIGGLDALVRSSVIQDKLSILPDFSNTSVAMTIFIVPLLIQWWSIWYPAAEPGGGGFVAQRMLAARNARHAVGGVLFFQACHYALRPWPWILVALASMIVFPDLASIQAAFPHIPAHTIGHDMAYPAMLTLLPTGLLGLVVASLASAYMSSMATLLNWGASYIVNDFWRTIVRPQASEAELVGVGRAATVALMLLAGAVALVLSSALQAFNILLSIGAGTGLLFLLRWYWWRINAYAEFAAMIVSFLVALCLHLFAPAGWSDSLRLVLGVAITTAGWMSVALLTPPTSREKLYSFLRLANPSGPGWRKIRKQAAAEGVHLPSPEDRSLARAMACVPAAMVGIYSLLFAIGCFLYGDRLAAVILCAVACAAVAFIAASWHRIFDSDAPRTSESAAEATA